MTDPDWRLRAACRGMDTNIFFIEQDKPDRTGEALAVCAKCPVKMPCRAEAESLAAVSDHAVYGVWGGVPQEDRRRKHRATRSGEKRLARMAQAGELWQQGLGVQAIAEKMGVTDVTVHKLLADAQVRAGEPPRRSPAAGKSGPRFKLDHAEMKERAWALRRQGLRQAAIAQAMGVSQSTVSEWLRTPVDGRAAG